MRRGVWPIFAGATLVLVLATWQAARACATPVLASSSCGNFLDCAISGSVDQVVRVEVRHTDLPVGCFDRAGVAVTEVLYEREPYLDDADPPVAVGDAFEVHDLTNAMEKGETYVVWLAWNGYADRADPWQTWVVVRERDGAVLSPFNGHGDDQFDDDVGRVVRSGETVVEGLIRYTRRMAVRTDRRNERWDDKRAEQERERERER